MCARRSGAGRLLHGGQVIGSGYMDLGGMLEKSGPELDRENNAR
jgi:hypothetical protein